MVVKIPYVISPRTHLVVMVLLSTLTFAYGFISALPGSPVKAEEAWQESPDAASEMQTSSLTESDEPSGVTSEAVEGTKASFKKVLPFPFESVLHAWENGPPDPNFIKEEVQVEKNGQEEHRMKTIYTKNPLPYVVRKTVLRDEMFIFEEDQRIDLQKRYSLSFCDNKVLESMVKAHRTANMRADPNNPNWTIFEQSMTISITGLFGNTVKRQLEAFAENLFISSAESGTTKLEESLAASEARKAEMADHFNGGGVWWTGGAETTPGADLHRPQPAVPQDSSAGYFGQTLDAWANWIWPSYFSSSAPVETAEDAASATEPASHAVPRISRTASVWWSEGLETDNAPMPAANPEFHAEGAACGAAAAGFAWRQRRPWQRARDGKGKKLRPRLHRISCLAQHAGSPAIMLAGIAAQVVSAGSHHFGADVSDLAHGMPVAATVSAPKTAPAAGTGSCRGDNMDPIGAGTHRGVMSSKSHPELNDDQVAAKELKDRWLFGGRLPRAPSQLRHMGSHVAGAAAAFISSDLNTL